MAYGRKQSQAPYGYMETRLKPATSSFCNVLAFGHTSFSWDVNACKGIERRAKANAKEFTTSFQIWKYGVTSTFAML